MSKIIEQAARGTGRSISLRFTRIDDSGSGFTFECEEDGTPKLANDAQRANYALALDATKYRAEGVRVDEWTYRIPAVLKCDCGREVRLDGFTCSCDCGRDYNSSGSLLAPRSQWGEETGETAADILAGGDGMESR